MSKRGVFWGLGGLLGVAVATLCILLVAVMGTGAQNSSQSSVEPQVTNLPTGETSDYEIAESPEVGQRAPSYQTPFQPNDGPSVALGPLPSESPPQASFTASSSTVARGETGTMEVVPQVTLSLNFASITEGEGIILTARLTEPLTGGVLENLTVELTVEGVTPGANLDDIKSAGNQFEFGDPLRDIVIPVGESQAGTTIISQNENLAEFDERFRIKVAQLGYGSNRSAPTKESSVELTIENRDFITATISASDTDEGDTVTVTITLDKALPVVPGGLAADDVKLVVRNKNRRADFGGLDENGTLNLVELFDGGTTAVVPLHLVDDMMFEPVEQGRLTVEGSPRLDPLFIDAIAAQNIYAEVRFQIIDNDAVRLVARHQTNDAEITTTTENSVFEVFAELAPGVTADRDVKIRFKYEFDSTDENGNVRTPLSCGEIFGCVPNTPNSRIKEITIKQGETRSTDVFFNDVQINDDDIVEETELFQLVPFETVPPATFDSTPIYITVLDDDTLTYEIRGADEIDENAGSYTVQLRRTGRITADATVAYIVSGGDSSPASDADFTGDAFPSGNFTFSGYDALSDEVTFTIEDDMLFEGDETFKISVTSGTSTPKEVMIIDDDLSGMPPVVIVMPELDVVTVTVSFSATSWYEGDDDILTATIKLANGMVAQSDITIDYELEFPTIDTDGNRRMAADVADFVGATSGSVLIKAGESSVNLRPRLIPRAGIGTSALTLGVGVGRLSMLRSARRSRH